MGTIPEKGRGSGLIPLTKRTKEQARAIRSAGGKASAEKRRQFKKLGETLKYLLTQPSAADPNVSYAFAVGLALVMKSVDGDTAAIRLLAELNGEMKQQIEVSTGVAKVSLGDWGKPHDTDS